MFVGIGIKRALAALFCFAFVGVAVAQTKIDLPTQTKGILPSAQFPALTGDVTTSVGTTTTVLSSVVTAGTCTSCNLTFDAKGRATAIASGSSGGVTSIGVAGSSGIASSGGPITSSGTVTLSLGDITPTSVNTGTVTATSTQIVGGTVTTSQPLINATQLWNNSGTTFTGLKLNITNTASASASLLADWQVGGASMFKVDKSGNLTVPGTLNTGSGSNLNAGYVAVTNYAQINQIWANSSQSFTVSGSTSGGSLVQAATLVLNNRDQTSSKGAFSLAAGTMVGFDVTPGFSTIKGAIAYASAVTNLVGGSIAIAGGDGASASAGLATGGDVQLDGGIGYGTGKHGNVVIGNTRGHLLVGGTAPTVAGSCGSSPTIAGKDNAAVVTAGTGSPTSCTVTFNTAFPNAPVCTANAQTTTTALNVVTTTTTVIVSAAALTASEKLYIHCIGY
jgi:hypothetical protein